MRRNERRFLIGLLIAVSVIFLGLVTLLILRTGQKHRADSETAALTADGEAIPETADTEPAESELPAAEEPAESEPSAAEEPAESDPETAGKEPTGKPEQEVPEKIEEPSPEEEDPTLEEAKRILAQMTLEDKIGQLFFVTADQLTGVSGTSVAGDTTRNAASAWRVGGIVLCPENLSDPEQTKALIAGTKQIYQDLGLPVPFFSTDEEGGTVARIASNSAFGVENVGNMIDVGAGGTPEDAARIGSYVGSYMTELGFSMNFAPCADVLTNPENRVVAKRSFGSDPAFVRDMVCAESDALREAGILPVWKHFPGHGATAGDTHEGYAYTDKSLEELLTSDLVPYENAIEHAPCIMAAHISLPGVTGDDTPATLSGEIITALLRERLGYDGVVITDALNMGAIVNQHSSAEAAVLAFSAGCDMLLMPYDFHAAYQGMLDAARNGTISMERIDASVLRILRLKQELAAKIDDQGK